MKKFTALLLIWMVGAISAACASTITIELSAGQLTDPQMLHHNLFGPPPATDDDLVQLANALDNIERQVAHS